MPGLTVPTVQSTLPSEDESHEIDHPEYVRKQVITYGLHYVMMCSSVLFNATC